MKNSYITVTDQFCGAGGSSIGALVAGTEIRQAMNHWRLATETYATNHPQTEVDCTDISACDPRRYRQTDILITSPECTNHSLAKGQQRKLQAQLELFGRAALDPSEERSRATMWDVVRFAEFHDYNIIIVENVVDARHWRLFDDWLGALHSLGYRHEIVYLNSMFAHPTPQSRDRMYVVCSKLGNRAPDLRFTPPAYCHRCERNVEAIQSWKNPLKKWGKYGAKRQYVYRCRVCTGEVIPYYFCAANAIDWSVKAERIGDRARPLKEKTMARIRVGLEKFGRESFLTSYYSRSDAQSSMDSPVPTVTTEPRHSLVMPFIVDLAYTHGHNNRVLSLTDTWPTQTGQQTLAFVVRMKGGIESSARPIDGPMPTLTTVGTPYLVELHGKSTAHPITDPLNCVLTNVHHGLVMPYLVEMHGTSGPKPITDPLGCILASAKHHALITPFTVSYYGSSEQARPVTEALGTVTTLDRHALVEPGEALPKVEDCYFRMLRSHETGRAMAFPSSYVVLGTEREKVKQYGNAVTPPVMTWLIEQCVKSLEG